MKIFFKEYLKVNLFMDDEFNSINLENPFASNLFDVLFNNLYAQIKNNQRNNLDSVIKGCLDNSNQSIFNMFRCSKCYDLMIIKIKINAEKKFEMKCSNCDEDYKLYTELDIKNAVFLILNCDMCNDELLLYKKNYKCMKCKKLLCSNCENKHLEKCLSLNYIQLYEVGYRCEIHYCKYTQYCFHCKKNLCKKCIEIHPHKIKEINNIDNDIKNSIKKYVKNLEELKELDLIKSLEKEEIIKYIYLIYISRGKINLFNGHMQVILCELLNLDLKEYNNDILFNKFNDQEFKKYYSVLLNKINDGNIYYLNYLDSMKPFYNKKKEFTYNFSNFTKREISIRLLIERCKSQWKDFNNFHKLINYDRNINKLNISNNNIKIKISELNSRILLLENSNKVLQENTHNILCRFLADELLQIIIVNYYNYLDPISLNLNILLDFVSKSNYDILSNDKIINLISNISSELSDKLNKFKINSKNKELKEEIIKLINSSNNIRFSKDLIINNETLKKEELNEILDILFFIKNFGNITAHPNININDSIKMKSLQSLPINFEIEYFYTNNLKNNIENKIGVNKNNILSEIKLLIDDDENNYYLNEDNNEINNEYNIFKNLEHYNKGLNDEIVNKIKEIRDDLLKNFDICEIKKQVKIGGIYDTIFNDKDQVIFKELKDFVNLLLRNTDDIIKKNLAIDIEKKLTEQNENVNELIESIKKIPRMLKNFTKLNIPRHHNLEKYIKKIEINQDKNYNKYIEFIDDFEERLFCEENFEADCDKSEIILEVCALLMVKIYEKENEYLNDIKKEYEAEIIKNLVYEDIEHKLNEIYQEFGKMYNTNSK